MSREFSRALSSRMAARKKRINQVFLSQRKM
jgi:hypothetical protein